MLQRTGHGRAARLRYDLNAFEVVQPGDHVLCAVTGAPIALDELRYWSFERQEPYADAAASLVGHLRASA